MPSTRIVRSISWCRQSRAVHVGQKRVRRQVDLELVELLVGQHVLPGVDQRAALARGPASVSCTPGTRRGCVCASRPTVSSAAWSSRASRASCASTIIAAVSGRTVNPRRSETTSPSATKKRVSAFATGLRETPSCRPAIVARASRRRELPGQQPLQPRSTCLFSRSETAIGIRAAYPVPRLACCTCMSKA